MTGYGRSEKEYGEYLISAEIRTVNSRYLDTNFRLPEVLTNHEGELKKLVTEQIERGQVTVKISLNGEEEKWSNLTINRDLLRTYQRLIRDIKQELDLTGSPSISDFLQLPDIITYEQKMPEDSRLLNQTKVVLEEALREVVVMRRNEGESIVDDLSARLETLDQSLDKIETESRESSLQLKETLQERIQGLLDDVPVDEERLAQEIAYVADKIDVTEETVRLRSHIQQFSSLLKAGGSIGKKLNFLLQEMNREINTIGAKSNNSAISHIVVDSKNELEKLREQVQNIE